jgi:hypothetical protein
MDTIRDWTGTYIITPIYFGFVYLSMAVQPLNTTNVAARYPLATPRFTRMPFFDDKCSKRLTKVIELSN